MSYNAASIRDTVEQINRNLYLPAIQRPYVWEPEQIVALFDSLMKGYPISAFLFWELKPENRRNWEIYSFIDNFRYGSTHNEIAEPDGRDIVLVLDGQQRLTSLLIGLRGTYTVKLKHKRWDNPTAWVRQRLFLDLLTDPAVEEADAELGISYGFKFFDTTPETDSKHVWYKVGEILDFDSEDIFDLHKDALCDALPGSVTRDNERLVRRNLERLYRMVWKEENISFYTERNQSYDRVLDIFIRANDGGTKLSKSDLLLSMITSKWHGVNAREEIYRFVDHINNDMERKNDFDKDFVMRACLVVSDLDHTYKVSNFTNQNLNVIQTAWISIREAVEKTVRLINRAGIDRDTLTSTNALMPIVYYLSKLDGPALDGTTPFEVRNRERIRRWLLGALLNNVFGGNSDQTIGTSRAIVKGSVANGRDFPLEELIEGLKARGRVMDFDETNLDALLDTRFGQRSTFLAVSLLYDLQQETTSNYHVDHIIPRSLCDTKKLLAMGLQRERIERIENCVDRLGNLELLIGRENLEKHADPFSDWIKTRDAGFRERHLIPSDPELWDVKFLPEFVAEREILIRQKIKTILGGLAKFGGTPERKPRAAFQ